MFRYASPCRSRYRHAKCLPIWRRTHFCVRRTRRICVEQSVRNILARFGETPKDIAISSADANTF